MDQWTKVDEAERLEKAASIAQNGTKNTVSEALAKSYVLQIYIRFFRRKIAEILLVSHRAVTVEMLDPKGKARVYTEEELSRRAAILQQYGYDSDEQYPFYFLNTISPTNSVQFLLLHPIILNSKPALTKHSLKTLHERP